MKCAGSREDAGDIVGEVGVVEGAGDESVAGVALLCDLAQVGGERGEVIADGLVVDQAAECALAAFELASIELRALFKIAMSSL